MPRVAIDVGAALILLLPGFLAYRFAVWRRPDPSQRGLLWQISEILEYSAYVHLIGATLVCLIHLFFLNPLNIDTHVLEMIQNSPADFLEIYFVEGVLWFTLYPIYVIFSSAILGAYDVPGIVMRGIPRTVSRLTIWISGKHRLLAWIPIPQEAYPQEPVWYLAFRSMAQDRDAMPPLVIVTLKSGDVYFGELASYPIVPDTQYEKDFLIVKARYYPGGDPNSEQELDLLDNTGAVLLNTVNVDSIKLYYDTGSGK